MSRPQTPTPKRILGSHWFPLISYTTGFLPQLRKEIKEAQLFLPYYHLSETLTSEGNAFILTVWSRMINQWKPYILTIQRYNLCHDYVLTLNFSSEGFVVFFFQSLSLGTQSDTRFTIYSIMSYYHNIIIAVISFTVPEDGRHMLNSQFSLRILGNPSLSNLLDSLWQVMSMATGVYYSVSAFSSWYSFHISWTFSHTHGLLTLKTKQNSIDMPNREKTTHISLNKLIM